jgi:hypothetical protein
MTGDAFARSLRAFCRRRPFSAFMIELVSGTAWRVDHPEALSLHGTVVIYTAPDSSQRLLDASGVAELYDVSRSPNSNISSPSQREGST